MEEIEEKERELRSAAEREDKEILQELGKYLESAVEQIESKTAAVEIQTENIAAEKEIHRVASELFEKAKLKQQRPEEINELLRCVNTFLRDLK